MDDEDHKDMQMFLRMVIIVLLFIFSILMVEQGERQLKEKRLKQKQQYRRNLKLMPRPDNRNSEIRKY